ncbi:MAG: zinc ribbon domain-containing protein [Lachnospiraceae bacterium]|nr:zinc ribbon domain-containing protein [Lachnospiraceae bacterium]
MLQELLENVGKNISETAETLGKRTERVVEIQKLKNQIRTANREIAQNYEELGEMLYRKHQAGETMDSQITAICEDITELKAEIASYKDEISKYRGESVCPECGAAVPDEAAFCMKCGTRMPVREVEFEEEGAEADSEAAENEDGENVASEEDFVEEPEIAVDAGAEEADGTEKAAEEA